jgi:hypothetical protein
MLALRTPPSSLPGNNTFNSREIGHLNGFMIIFQDLEIIKAFSKDKLPEDVFIFVYCIFE